MSEQGTSHLLPTYARVDLAFERGEGAWLVATNGERYLDFTSGVAVNALGHAHPHLIEAITEQVKKVTHVSNLYRIPEAERMAARLCEASFADSKKFLDLYYGANYTRERVESWLTYGSPQDCIADIKRYRACGCNRMTFRISTMGDPMHQLERLARDVLPYVNDRG